MTQMANTSSFDSSSVSTRDIEEALVRSAQEGCRASFTQLVRIHSERLYKFIYQRTQNKSDAEDICQETFIKAYEKIGTYNFQSKFSTWLFTIALRKSIDAFRKSKDSIGISEITEIAADTGSPQSDLLKKESREQIWEIARQLSDSQYEAMELRYVAGMDIMDVARTMKVTNVYAKVLLFRARSKMASLLREADIELDYITGRRGSRAESTGGL